MSTGINNLIKDVIELKGKIDFTKHNPITEINIKAKLILIFDGSSIENRIIELQLAEIDDSNQNLLSKITELEEKIQSAEEKINMAQNQKNHYDKQFLEISRELANSILLQKVKSEVNPQ